MTWRPALPGLSHQVTLFLAYNALLHIGLIGISDALLNFYFVSLGYGAETIGLLQSLPRVSGFLSSVPIGLLANRVGVRRVTLWATVGLAASYALLVAWPGLIAFGFSRFLVGLFYGAVQIGMAPLMMTLVRAEHQSHIFAYHNLVSMGGTAVGSVAGGFLPLLVVALFPEATRVAGIAPERTPFAYRVALSLAAALILLSALPLLRLAETYRPPAVRGLFSTASGRIPWRWLTWLTLPLLLFGFTGGLTFPFYNLFFRTTFGIADKTVGTVLSLGWLGMALLPLANPWWDRHWGRVRTLGITMSVAALAFAGLSVAPSLAIGVGCYVVAISCRNVMQPVFQPLLMDSLPPDLHNIASSIGMVQWNVGWFAATAVSGFWQTAYGFDMIMRVVAVGVFLTGASVVWLFRNQRPYRPAVPETCA